MSHLIHDCALIGANEILHLFENVILGCEYKDAHEEVYRVIVATLEAYQVQKRRMESRLFPLN